MTKDCPHQNSATNQGNKKFFPSDWTNRKLVCRRANGALSNVDQSWNSATCKNQRNEVTNWMSWQVRKVSFLTLKYILVQMMFALVSQIFKPLEIMWCSCSSIFRGTNGSGYSLIIGIQGYHWPPLSWTKVLKW